MCGCVCVSIYIYIYIYICVCVGKGKEKRHNDKFTLAYPFNAACDKYADGAMRHLNLRLSASKTPMLPSQKVA